MLRVYGRVTNPDGTKKWVVVETNPQGYNDAVYITALIQCLKLNINESPFWANYGIPAKSSIVQQVWPDFAVSLMQQRYASYFASLTIVRQPTFTPTYQVNITTNQGNRITETIAT